jgi:hypothetical protein
MSAKTRIKAAIGFVLAWLSTPTSRAGIVTMVSAFIGNGLAPNVVEGVAQAVILGAGAALILWPQKPSNG